MALVCAGVGVGGAAVVVGLAVIPVGRRVTRQGRCDPRALKIYRLEGMRASNSRFNFEQCRSSS
jgi:hypothetical protein